MKRVFFKSMMVLMATASLSLSLQARTLQGLDAWSVRQVSAETPYCTASRQYEAGASFTLAQNIQGEGTLALKFDRDAFDASRPYPIKIMVSGQERHFAVKPASAKMIVLRLGQDQDLLQSLSSSNTVNVVIDSENFSLDLSDYPVAYQDVVNCLGTHAAQIPSAPVTENVQTGRVEQNRTQDQNVEIDSLLEENRRLTERLTSAPAVTSVASSKEQQLLQKLVMAERRNAQLVAQINQLEADLITSRQSLNPDLNGIIQQKDKQLSSLQQQNKSLRVTLAEAEKQSKQVGALSDKESQAMRVQLAQLELDVKKYKAERNQYRTQIQTAQPEVVIKEVIKEVPVIPADMSASDAEIAARLAETQTQASIYKAERDEYRRLLQSERKRIKDLGGVGALAAASQMPDNKSTNMVSDIQKLKADKADLQRQLAYTKSLVNVDDTGNGTDEKIAVLTAELAAIEKNFLQLKQEKKSMQGRLSTAEVRAKQMEKQLAQAKVNELANMQPAAQKSNVEMKTLRAELAALEAQNKVLRNDIVWSKQSRDKVAVKTTPTRKSSVSMPIKDTRVTPQALPVSNNLKMRRTVTPALAKLSGSDIRKIVHSAKIPLAAPVDRVDRVSGPDFAAFTWDTGVVYGSAEQSRMSNLGAFDRSVEQYIQKTRSRCIGSFDQTITNRKTPGMTVRAADIACVDANGQGAAASILFFVHKDMFYAMAHEADMNSFQVAMDMRDRLSSSVASAF